MLQQAGLADIYHYNLMLGHGCTTVAEVELLLDALAEAPDDTATEGESQTPGRNHLQQHGTTTGRSS